MANRQRFCDGVADESGGHRPMVRFWRHIMNILWTLIVGLVVGALAKLIMPGRDPGGIIITMLLGIAGAFVGTLVGRAMGLYSAGQGAGWIMSIVGAILLLAIYRVIVGRRTTVI
jgi:uncharacterized membrane protein YeaQ/YmgE (transglycosylase-associated protein family)